MEELIEASAPTSDVPKAAAGEATRTILAAECPRRARAVPQLSELRPAGTKSCGAAPASDTGMGSVPDGSLREDLLPSASN